MDYDAIHHSLDFINTYFKKQASIYEVPILEQKNGNSILWGQSGKFRYEYRIGDFCIATKLNLFETNSLKGEISQELSGSPQPEEVKTILQNLLSIAKSNISLYDEIYNIRYKNGAFNSSYNDVPIINKIQYLCIENDKEIWIPTDQNFNSHKYKEYNIKLYTIEDFYRYSAIFYNHVNELISDWIKSKEDEDEKRKLEIKKLKYEKYYLMLGWLFGFLSTLIILLLKYWLDNKR